jgi:hypothetical protein
VVAAGADGVAVFEFSSPVPAVWSVGARIGGVDVTGSPQTAVFVDAVGPRVPLSVPQVAPSNGVRLAGEVAAADRAVAAEGGLVVVVAGVGGELARCPVAGDGSFACVLPGLGNGTEVSVWIEDSAGGVSPVVLLAVDAVPPSPGTVSPSDGAQLAGTGEIGAQVVVTAEDGTRLCSAVVSTSGTWACALAPLAGEGELVAVEHTDSAGNSAEFQWRIGVPRVMITVASVVRGGTQTAVGVNFQPGEAVEAVMYSDPQVVGTANADADGRVEFSWAVPPAAEVGNHLIVFTGAVSGSFQESFAVVAGGAPTGEPTGGPTGTPTGGPTGNPTSGPTAGPTGEPTGTPTGGPPGTPTGEPSAGPTGEPTGTPTGEPSAGPTGEPTTGPTGEPTIGSSYGPTGEPTAGSSVGPTASASAGGGGGKLPLTGSAALGPVTALALALMGAGALALAWGRRKRAN